MEILDVWNKLNRLFDGDESDEEIQPEIILAPLNSSEMSACVHYLLRQSRDCTSQFVIAGTKQVVYLSSPHAVVKNIVEGNISCAMWVTLPSMPPVGAYIDSHDSINLSYVRGTWNAMTVLMFFDLLQRFKAFAPELSLKASPHTFSVDERKLFADVWQDYLNAFS